MARVAERGYVGSRLRASDSDGGRAAGGSRCACPSRLPVALTASKSGFEYECERPGWRSRAAAAQGAAVSCGELPCQRGLRDLSDVSASPVAFSIDA
jgi:hypothetical protein